MQTFILTEKVTLESKECPVCHIIYAVPQELLQRAEERGGSWYCPNGHNLIFCETEVNRLKHKLDQRDAEIERTKERLNGALKEVTNKKRQLTRIKSRIHNGVCPECNRYFINLDEHQKTQHGKPDEKVVIIARHKGERCNK